MSDSDQNNHADGPLRSAVWSLAALSAALFLCSVLAAKLVGDMVESQMSRIAAAVTAAAPVRKGARGAVDPTATGSIRRNAASDGAGRTLGQATK